MSRTSIPSRWFRMYAEFAHDPKVQMLSEADQRRYMMLLCMRCSNGDVTLHDEDVTFVLRVTPEEWMRTKAVLRAKNLIDDDNKPPSWEKRQYASDSSAERVAKHRALQKQSRNNDVTLQSRPVEAEAEAEAEAEVNPSVGTVPVPSVEDGEKSESGPPCPHKKILELYAKHLPMLTQPRLWEGARADALKTRWRYLQKPNGVTRGFSTLEGGLDLFDKYFAYVAESKTLTEGIKRNDGGKWLPDLSWLIKAENFAKVVEGKYHDEARQ